MMSLNAKVVEGNEVAKVVGMVLGSTEDVLELKGKVEAELSGFKVTEACEKSSQGRTYHVFTLLKGVERYDFISKFNSSELEFYVL